MQRGEVNQDDEATCRKATRSVGGGKRDRTADLLHAMQALSQLSYTPLQNRSEILNINFAFVKSF